MKICEKKRLFRWAGDVYEWKYITLQMVVVNLSGKAGLRLTAQKTKESTVNF